MEQQFINQDIITLLGKHIDWVCVLLVICGGLFATKYGKTWKVDNALKTLIVGSLFIALYIVVLALSEQLHKEDYSKYFISYCVATSFYELLLKRIAKLLGLNKEAQ